MLPSSGTAYQSGTSTSSNFHSRRRNFATYSVHLPQISGFARGLLSSPSVVASALPQDYLAPCVSHLSLTLVFLALSGNHSSNDGGSKSGRFGFPVSQSLFSLIAPVNLRQ